MTRGIPESILDGTDCSVCGFLVDPLIQQEPEQAVFSIVQTGTTYAAPTGTPVEDMDVEDLRTEAVRPGGGSGCPFCGSPRVFDGSAPDLLR
jgi:hypothetical protein